MMSTKSDTNPKWDTLQSLRFKRSSQPFMINNHEFIVATSKTISTLKGDGIYKFNINKNEWIKIFDCGNFSCNILSSAYDNNNKLLYVCHYPYKMLTFDLKNQKFTSLEDMNKVHFELICVENKLHQICNKNGDHYIYDESKEFKQIATFSPFVHLNDYQLIHLKSQKCILAFGGHNNNNGFQNSIYKFSFSDSKWNELNIKMPKKLSKFGAVSTKNEQYIIILGGWTDVFQEDSDDIFIYNTRNNIFIKSKIKCPKKGQYNAIIMNNSKRDEMASFGYVNDSYKLENFIDMQLLPQYLIKIIGCYYCYEELHLLHQVSGKKLQLQWKMNVDYILQ